MAATNTCPVTRSAIRWLCSMMAVGGVLWFAGPPAVPQEPPGGQRSAELPLPTADRTTEFDEVELDERELELLSPDFPDGYLEAARKYLQYDSPEAQAVANHLLRVAATLCRGEKRAEALALLAFSDPDPLRAAAARALLIHSRSELARAALEQLRNQAVAATGRTREEQNALLVGLHNALSESVANGTLAPLAAYRESSPSAAAVVDRLLATEPIVRQHFHEWQRMQQVSLAAEVRTASDQRQGRRKCATCGGTGVQDCPIKACHNGTVRCPKCRGAGFRTRIVTVRRVVSLPTGGSIPVPERRRVHEQCQACKGQARWLCTVCKGRGNIGPCPECGGRGKREQVAAMPRWHMPADVKRRLSQIAQRLDGQSHPIYVQYLLAGGHAIPCTVRDYERVLREPRVYRRGGLWVQQP